MGDGKFKLALVKISNGEAIPDDEPIFILRARDLMALHALRAYQEVCRTGGCNDYQMNGIKSAIDRFRRFQLDHPEKMKEPGITRGA